MNYSNQHNELPYVCKCEFISKKRHVSTDEGILHG